MTCCWAAARVARDASLRPLARQRVQLFILRPLHSLTVTTSPAADGYAR